MPPLPLGSMGRRSSSGARTSPPPAPGTAAQLSAAPSTEPAAGRSSRPRVSEDAAAAGQQSGRIRRAAGQAGGPAFKPPGVSCAVPAEEAVEHLATDSWCWKRALSIMA